MFLCVPQGSILGLLLFNVFINDLLFILNGVDICNFADDNSIYCSGRPFDEVREMLGSAREKCLCWFRENHLTANPGKFQVVFLGTNAQDLSLCIDGKEKEASNQVKLLGVTIDRYLKFDTHIRNLCSKANNKINCLLRIRKFLSEDQAKRLSDAYILSSFNYCPLIWMFCGKQMGKLIAKTQKRCLRVVSGDWEQSLPNLLLKYKQPSIHTMHLRSLMVEVFKTLRGSGPQFMREHFVLKEIPFSLRRTQLLALPPTSTKTHGTRCIRFQAPLIWNSLPAEVKDASSIGDFKRKLRGVVLKCSCKLCSF